MRAIPRPQLRSIALPSEHGVWGFWLEPSLLGLLLAPSWAGLALVGAALAALLAQHPLSLWLADRRRGAWYPRTRYAAAFAGAYSGVAALLLVATISLAANAAWLTPLLFAVPLALVQLAFDAQHQSRRLLPELAGAGALGALASSIALAGGWPADLAWALWGLLAARSLPAILYVRTRLRLERGEDPNILPTWLSHLGALAAALIFITAELAPWLSLVAFTLLLARAGLGTSRGRKPAKAKAIGFRELGFGLVTVAILAAGYALSW
ncbi:MAG: YwiC-like family protein [Truepera sp.]|nr:YwiC-like family protein [Truepera sp.]